MISKGVGSVFTKTQSVSWPQLEDANGWYRNLVKMDSLAYIDGYYYKPRIDIKLLEQYSEGVICLSACLSGKIPRLLTAGDYEGAKAYATRLKNMFAEGDSI